MADGPMSPEIRNGEIIQLATPLEIERAKKGVGQFQAVLGLVDGKTRKRLVDGDGSKMLHSMFLGIKPVSLPALGEIPTFEVPELGPYIKKAGHRFYEPDQTQQAVVDHPDVFDDFDPKAGIDAYMQKLASTKSHLKFGLLFGFPENAVRNYDRYQEDYYLPYVQDVVIGPFGMGWASIIVNNPDMTFFTGLEKQILMSFIMQQIFETWT